jgi:diacylglycerol O-acyltransferase
MGLFIATPSYNGEITFNVTSTREIVPDMDFFIECIEASLESLKAAARPKNKAGKKKAAKKKAAARTQPVSKQTPAA